MRRSTLERVAVVACLVVTASGCGSAAPTGGEPEPPITTAAAERPTYEACRRTPADPKTTNLRPIARIDAANDAWDGGPIPHGTVAIEHATELALTDGQLGAGNGYEAAMGTGSSLMRVAEGSVVAPVTLVVLDSPQAGRRVAFVEVRITTTAPVRWEVSDALGIATDGGDGGLARGTAAAVPDDDSLIDDYVDAFFPGRNSDSGNVCVLRRSQAGEVDAVLFSTGYGDGVYPAAIGRDEAGEVASVVSVGYVLPWRYSGLPGTPPPDIDG